MSAVTERPPEFDRRVMQYLPGLKTLARKFTRTTEERDDLVTDTIAKALEDWQKFREDGGFWNWLYWTMRGIAGNRVQYDRRRIDLGSQLDVQHACADSLVELSVRPTQGVRLDLADALLIVGSLRHGDILMRVANGETLRAIAAERGLSKERVRQLVAAARRELEDRS